MRSLTGFLVLLGLCFAPAPQAGLLTTFEGAMQANAPAPGWAYLYNPGPIGASSGYQALQATSDPESFYDYDGNPGIPGNSPEPWVYLGLVRAGQTDAGTPGGHPGIGSSQDTQDGLSHYAIAAYTLGQAGHYGLRDTRLRNAGSSYDGLDLRVYVNDLLKFNTQTGAGDGQAASFDTALGWLQAGDRIYVAVGSRENDLSDSFSLRYAIEIPEPSALALMLLFGGLIPVYSRRAPIRIKPTGVRRR